MLLKTIFSLSWEAFSTADQLRKAEGKADEHLQLRAVPFFSHT